MAAIAVLGWGSLIWKPDGLAVRSKWHTDGPCLPVEFARKSSGMRVTLVLVPGYEHLSRAYWAVSAFGDIGTAAHNLMEREKCTSLKPIHVADAARWWSAGGGSGPRAEFGSEVSAWVAARDDVDAAIWTGLQPKVFKPKSTRVPLADQVVGFLRSLSPGYEGDAREYVQKAPASIDTPVRRAIEEELDWSRERLPSDLFEGMEPGSPCQ